MVEGMTDNEPSKTATEGRVFLAVGIVFFAVGIVFLTTGAGVIWITFFGVGIAFVSLGTSYSARKPKPTDPPETHGG